MELNPFASAAGGVERFQHHWDQVIGALAHKAKDIQRVADLAIQRVVDGGVEPLGVCGRIGHHPGAASSVQTYGRAGLPRDGAQLGYRGA
jgi:hypothetical protein